MADNHLDFELDGELAKYDRWAKALAWKYTRPNAFVTWDDIYQTAMLSCLETMGANPGRHPGYYMTRMRWDVLKEIRHYEVSRNHECEYDQTLQACAGDDVERAVISDKVEDIIGQCMTYLPDDEFVALSLKVCGYEVKPVLMAAGWPRKRAQVALTNGRKRIKSWLHAVEVI